MEFSVYLGGPITGESYKGCTGWREFVAEQFWRTYNTSKHSLHALSPMRHKDYLLQETSVADSYDDTLMSSQRGIFARDRFDCMRCDLFFVNVLDASKVSIGTVLEVAWANSRDIPIILIMEDEGNIHEHSMIREACPFRVNNIKEGILLTRNILFP